MKLTSPPRLPLVDNAFFIDNSSLEYIITCPRSALFHNILRRRIGGPTPALNFGGAMHKAWDYRYSKCPDYVSEADRAAMHRILKEHFEETPAPIDDHRTLDLAIAMIDAYNQHYMTEPFSVIDYNGQPAVELSFAYELFRYKPLTGPEIIIFWTGRIDAVVREAGQIFTMDHKTSSILGDGFFRSEGMSGQHRGYAWAYQQGTDTIPAGYIINACRVPRPTIKDGFNIKPDGFQRAKFYLSQDDLDEWREETVAHVTHFLDMYYLDGYFPAARKWCVNKYGTCQYYDVCSLQESSRETMLASGVYEDNVWSPLHGEVKPKPLGHE